VSLADRVRRLERSPSVAGGGWQLYEPMPPPDPEGDDFWSELTRIRDSHPDPAVKNMSLMQMAEDLVPGLQQRVKEGADAYEVSHEFRWMNGCCYLRKRPGLSRERNVP
jgi:hypothetical protein